LRGGVAPGKRGLLAQDQRVAAADVLQKADGIGLVAQRGEPLECGGVAAA
jgi:hypothetical protein